MKKVVALFAGMLLCLPTLTPAVELAGNSFTILRLEEQAVPGFAKRTLAPATEFIRLDANGLGSDRLSLHLYGWGRADLADRSTADGSLEGELTYGYLEYRFPEANGQLKAGRFFVVEGVANEQVDGLSARVDLPAALTLSTFAGVPVLLDRDSKSKGDYIVGGRLSWRLAGVLELGASGLQEGAVKLSNGSRDQRQQLGGDVWFRPCSFMELNGHTYYNAATGGLAEHSYLLIVNPVKSLAVTGSYENIRFKDNFAFTNLPSPFDPATGDRVESYGGSVTWTGIKQLEVSADFKRFRRGTIGDSNRYGGELRLLLADNRSRSGVSYHRLDLPNAINPLFPSYHQVRAYTMYDTGPYRVSLDGIADFYDEQIDGERTAYEVIASLGYRITPALSLSGDISYGQNPRLRDETRGVLRLSYDFNFAGKGASR